MGINAGWQAVKYMVDELQADVEKLTGERDRAFAEMRRLRAALADACDALRNDFEPDNQSKAWHRAKDALDR